MGCLEKGSEKDRSDNRKSERNKYLEYAAVSDMVW